MSGRRSKSETNKWERRLKTGGRQEKTPKAECRKQDEIKRKDEIGLNLIN